MKSNQYKAPFELNNLLSATATQVQIARENFQFLTIHYHFSQMHAQVQILSKSNNDFNRKQFIRPKARFLVLHKKAFA